MDIPDHLVENIIIVLLVTGESGRIPVRKRGKNQKKNNICEWTRRWKTRLSPAMFT